MRSVMPTGAPRLPPAIQEFGGRVRSHRARLGFSQEQLAEASGLHRTYVGSVERGGRNVTLVNILHLAKGLGIDAAELVRDLRI